MTPLDTARSRRHAGLIGIAAAALVVAGCSPDQESSDRTATSTVTTPTVTAGAGPSSAVASAPGASTPGASSHNQADVEFTSTMIVHHMQAVEMAELVEGRTDNAELIALADRIEDAQENEIDQMTDRLRSWGVAVPDHDDDHGEDGHMQHGPHAGAMAGMMTAEQMAALRAARGAEFDRLWLEGMIRHHRGAIEMADEELAEGENPATRRLAEQVKATQQAEIDQMEKMLGR
ncbi:DUF305 domain-containing protein [Gordonia paraffinivorans]|uniref:DUF305 domain-containing protein n=1 Tax=Gordonia paraffinivorans TaxID=175628 RepID=UPI0014484A8E|nr:DUF305 domain-containing protein [Gordonia paraffinivorans]